MGSHFISSALPPEAASHTCRVESVTLQNGMATKRVTANLGDVWTWLTSVQSRLPGQPNRLQWLSVRRLPCHRAQQAKIHLRHLIPAPNLQSGDLLLLYTPILRLFCLSFYLWCTACLCSPINVSGENTSSKVYTLPNKILLIWDYCIKF